MNCIDVRRQLLSEPTRLDAQLRSHLQSCAECARFTKGLVSFEREMKKAAEVAVPEGLASRILLQQRMYNRRRIWKWNWVAIAASVFLVVSMITLLGTFNKQHSLEESVLAHIENELYHLQDRNNVTLNDLNRLLASQGLRIETLNRQVNYAGACLMRRQEGVHLVLDSTNGPVTVLLMPGEFVDDRRMLKSKNFQGVITPIPNGSMAIVAEHELPWRQVEQILSKELVPLV